MLLEKDQANIGKLRTRGRFRDEPAFQLALSSKLDCIDFIPKSLPPTAILIVKQLTDPTPVKLSLRAAQVYLDSEWESTTQDQLEQCYQHALRPQQGFIPADAEAVVFTEHSELLACLSYDFASGTTSQHWWWDVLLKNISMAENTSKVLLTHLLEDLIYLPAMLEKLKSWQKVEKVLKTITPDDCRVLSFHLAQEHGLFHLAEAIEDTSRRSFVKSSTQRDHSLIYLYRDHKEDSQQQFQQQLAFYKQWVGKVTYFPEGLAKEQTFLLVLGLILQHEPWLVHNKQFQEDAINVWSADSVVASSQYTRNNFVGINKDKHEAASNISVINPINLKEDTDTSRPDTTHINNIDTNNNSGVDNKKVTNADHIESSISKKKRITKQGKNKILKADSKIFTDKSIKNNKEAMKNKNSASAVRVDTKLKPLTTIVKEDFEFIKDNNYANEFITTELGGILYLINLMNWLDLPNSFEKNWRLASQLGPWSLLELLGRALIDDRDAIYSDDFLWPLLAELDGRQTGTLPGASFIGHDEFRLPNAWFDEVKVEHETYFWSSAKGRLRLWATSGYMLVDVVRSNKTPKHQATIEVQNYVGEKYKSLLSKSSFSKAPISHCKIFDEQGLNLDLRRFLGYIIPYLQFRLLLALGDDKLNSIETILHCRGKIYFSSSHIDFVTPIENINLKSRRSGLDCDPGWLADYGRVVQFHFD